MTGPLFKWFGSKWAASKYYPPPIHEWIFEPYAGSAGYSLRHASRKVVLFEKNENVAALWLWLIRTATDALIREIPVGLPVGTDIRTVGLTTGQALLLKHWQRTNNVGDCWTTSPWGHLPGQWTENTRARVADEVGAVKHWLFDPILFDSEGTYFIDPPYKYNYRYGDKSWFDYEALVAKLREIPHPRQIIACEAVCPKTGLIPDYLEFQEFRRMVTSRRKASNHHHSSELLFHLVNDTRQP